MVRVNDVLSALCALAPTERKMEFDNVGLLVGHGDRKISRVLVCLDITEETVREAMERGAELIVSHHPLFFSLKKITADDPVGRTALTLAEQRIAAICMHTNLDVSRGGVNDALADRLGIHPQRWLCETGSDETGDYGLGRVGELSCEMLLSEFLTFVKTALNANGLRYVDGGRVVKKVALCGGSGGSELEAAVKAGCDTFVTADIKYNTFLDAKSLGINLIDAGHFPTENVVVRPLADYLERKFTELRVLISECHVQPEQFL